MKGRDEWEVVEKRGQNFFEKCVIEKGFFGLIEKGFFGLRATKAEEGGEPEARKLMKPCGELNRRVRGGL